MTDATHARTLRAAVKLVGQRAGGREHIVAHARKGDPVLILPEPDNPHDANAIAIYTAPRSSLQHPEALVSSVTDPDSGGTIHPEDRLLLTDRQAGYVPRTVNERFAVPPEGLIGFVSEIRWAPPDYDEHGREREPVVAGFDITAEWPTR